MKKRKLKSRNPIAKAVRKLGVKIVPDKRESAIRESLRKSCQEVADKFFKEYNFDD